MRADHLAQRCHGTGVDPTRTRYRRYRMQPIPAGETVVRELTSRGIFRTLQQAIWHNFGYGRADQV